ncbi:MAG: aldehyde dehydrogenase family protein [Candidatus Nanopelagicaceae bacterium]
MSNTLYINGKWSSPVEGHTWDVNSPADGHLVATVAEATAADVELAIVAARQAFDSGEFPHWGFEKRAALVSKIADLMERDLKVLAKLESDDTGKRLIEAEYDIADVIACFRHFAELGKRQHERQVDVGIEHVDSRVVQEPVGVCTLIGPWNYPLLQVSWKVAPALVAGCTFIVKPAELTPSTAIHLFKLIDEAGVPAGVANLILGKGSSIGDLLTSDPRIDLVSFTGSLGIGQRIMSLAAKTIKKVALELGGKNPNIIFADSDIDAAIDNAVTAGFLHSGQVCSAGTRLIVEKSIHDQVVNEIVRRAKDIKLGGPNSADAETGPLISANHLQKVQEYVEKGVAEGAELLVGGKRLMDGEFAKGYFFPPTVLDNCNTKMSCVQDESFGPIITVETFETEAEAIAIANDTIYGLSGAVWSKDEAKAARVSRALRHGTVWVNDYGPYKPQAEWGGFKASGIGRELGEHGLTEFLESKHIWTNNKPGKSGWFATR